MTEKDTAEHGNDIVGTTRHSTKTTVSSALMTVTCLSTPLMATQGSIIDETDARKKIDIQIVNVAQPSAQSNFVHPEQEKKIIDAIDALEKEKELYDARALYASRQSERIMTLDWLAYKQYLQESIRYKQRSEQTQKKIDELKAELEKIRSS